jgi:hypothetical protein
MQSADDLYTSRKLGTGFQSRDSFGGGRNDLGDVFLQRQGPYFGEETRKSSLGDSSPQTFDEGCVLFERRIKRVTDLEDIFEGGLAIMPYSHGRTSASSPFSPDQALALGSRSSPAGCCQRSR